jgi:YD repeat-containing protein
MYDATGRGSLGFTTVTVTDANGNVTDSTLAQSFPYVGMPMHVVKRSSDCTFEDTVNTLDAISFNLAAGGQNLFVYNKSSNVTQSLDCRDARTITSVNEYTDGWGNLNKQTVTTTAAGKSFVAQTTKVFNTVSGQNFLSGLPKSVVSTRTDPISGTLTRTMAYDYDTNGLIKTQTIEPDDPSLTLTTTFGRDRNVFGLVNTQTQTWTNPACTDAGWMAIKKSSCVSNMSVVVSDVTFDSKGRFASITKNALGQSETGVYDAKSGAPTSRVDANQLTTSWTVNSLGRVTVERTPDGNEKRINLKDCQGGCANGATVAQVTELFHGVSRIAAPQVTYLDSAGHAVRSRNYYRQDLLAGRHRRGNRSWNHSHRNELDAS